MTCSVLSYLKIIKYTLFSDMKLKMSRRPYTLLEVVIGMVIFSILAVGVITGVIRVANLNYVNAQRVAAYGLGYDAVESLKSDGYDAITDQHDLLTPSLEKLTHLGGSGRVPLYAWRWGHVEEKNNPERKKITIWVGWNYQNRNQFEEVIAVVLPREE